MKWCRSQDLQHENWTGAVAETEASAPLKAENATVTILDGQIVQAVWLSLVHKELTLNRQKTMNLRHDQRNPKKSFIAIRHVVPIANCAVLNSHRFIVATNQPDMITCSALFKEAISFAQ